MKMNINITELVNKLLVNIAVLLGLCLLGAAIVFVMASLKPVEASERVSVTNDGYIARRPLTAPEALVSPKRDTKLTIGRIHNLQSAETGTIRLRTYQRGDRKITTGRVGEQRIYIEERNQ